MSFRSLQTISADSWSGNGAAEASIVSEVGGGGVSYQNGCYEYSSEVIDPHCRGGLRDSDG